MKRLLQIGTVMMLLASLAPLLELFDRWDRPGLSNDTEYAVFAIVLIICLVLLVCKLITADALKLGFASVGVFLLSLIERTADAGSSIRVSPQLFLVALRI